MNIKIKTLIYIIFLSEKQFHFVKEKFEERKIKWFALRRKEIKSDCSGKVCSNEVCLDIFPFSICILCEFVFPRIRDYIFCRDKSISSFPSPYPSFAELMRQK
jgi:hypothetical protein